MSATRSCSVLAALVLASPLVAAAQEIAGAPPVPAERQLWIDRARAAGADAAAAAPAGRPARIAWERMTTLGRVPGARGAGALRAAGTCWVADFSPSGPAVVGCGAPELAPARIALRLTDVRRGGAELPSAVGLPREPVLGDGSVRYRVSAEIEEVYAVHPEGLELRFHVAGPLPGAGDLELAVAFETELALPPGDCTRGAELAAAGVVPARLGALTVIDAAGTVLDGAMAFEGERLVLRVPAETLAAAVYPLAIDPIIYFGWTDPDLEDFGIGFLDLAHDETHRTYGLVYYREQTASGESEAVFQRLDSGGNPLGPGQWLGGVPDASATFQRPSIASVSASDCFLVATVEDGAVPRMRLHTFLPENHTEGARDTLLLSAPSGFRVQALGVGGEALPPYDSALVAWSLVEGGPFESARMEVRTRLLRVDGFGAMTWASGENVVFTSPQGWIPFHLAVTPSGGAPGRWLCAWDVWVAEGTAIEPFGKFAQVVDYTNTPLGTAYFVWTPQASGVQLGPQVATDGSRFYLAFADGPRHDKEIDLRRLQLGSSPLRLRTMVARDFDFNDELPSTYYEEDQFALELTSERVVLAGALRDARSGSSDDRTLMLVRFLDVGTFADRELDNLGMMPDHCYVAACSPFSATTTAHSDNDRILLTAAARSQDNAVSAVKTWLLRD